MSALSQPPMSAWADSVNTMVDEAMGTTDNRTVAEQAKAAGRAAVTMLQNLPATVKRRFADVSTCAGASTAIDDDFVLDVVKNKRRDDAENDDDDARENGGLARSRRPGDDDDASGTPKERKLDEDEERVEVLKRLSAQNRFLFTCGAVLAHCVALRLLVGASEASYLPLVLVGLVSFVVALSRGPEADEASARWHLERRKSARREEALKLESEVDEREKLLRRFRDVRAVPGSSLKRAEASPGPPMTWEPVPPSKPFLLRGKNYLQDRKKQPSPAALYEPFAADLLRSRDPFFGIPNVVALPEKTPEEEKGLPDWLPRVLVQNMFFPGTPPPLLPGFHHHHKKDDVVKGYTVVCYWRVTPETIRLATELAREEENQDDDDQEGEEEKNNNGGKKDGSSSSSSKAATKESSAKSSSSSYPAHLRLWKRYVLSAQREPGLNGCLKGVASVANLEDRDLGLPGLVRRYNAKPVLMAASALVGERPGVVKITRSVEESFLEFGLNVGTDFAAVSNQALHQMKPTFPKLVLDLGWLVEGRNADDLPEGLLASMRINKVDLTKATDVDEWLAARHDDDDHHPAADETTTTTTTTNGGDPFHEDDDDDEVPAENSSSSRQRKTQGGALPKKASPRPPSPESAVVSNGE